LQKVQGCALTGEYGAGGAVQFAQRRTSRYPITVLYPPLKLHRGIELPEGFIEPRAAGDNCLFTADDTGLQRLGGRDKGSRDIAQADVLAQCAGHLLRQIGG
jgi:hypothetical protein